jgi:hypothetical protein
LQPDKASLLFCGSAQSVRQLAGDLITLFENQFDVLVNIQIAQCAPGSIFLAPVPYVFQVLQAFDEVRVHQTRYALGDLRMGFEAAQQLQFYAMQRLELPATEVEEVARRLRNVLALLFEELAEILLPVQARRFVLNAHFQQKSGSLILHLHAGPHQTAIAQNTG